MICAACGKDVRPNHWYRSGKARCRNRLTWTRDRLNELEFLIADGKSDAVIAKRLGVSPEAVNLARKRHGIKSRTEATLNCRKAAELLGIPCAKSITRWIEHGWLRARTCQRRGGNRQWLITQTALLDFLEDERYWQCWDLERIPAGRIRDFATRLRGNVRFLSLSEVARRCFVEHTTVGTWLDRGWLPHYRNGRANRVVRERDLEGFIPPGQRTRQKRPPDVAEFSIPELPQITAVVQRVADRWTCQLSTEGRELWRSRRPNRERKTAVTSARRAARIYAAAWGLA